MLAPLLKRVQAELETPRDLRWPEKYGIVGGPMPRGYLNQFMYPFRKTDEEKAAEAAKKVSATG